MLLNSAIFTILAQANLLTAAEISAAAELAASQALSPLSACLRIKPSLSNLTLLTALSHFYGIPLLDISAYNLDHLPHCELPTEFIISQRILPLAIRDKRLKLAIVDPTNKELIESISFKTGLSIDLVLVAESQLEQLIKQNGRNYFSTIELDETLLAENPLRDVTGSQSALVNSAAADQPLVKFVHKIIFDAVQLGASDIHFEPYENNYRVRYRIDGVLSEVATPACALKEQIAARLKVVAKLDIAEKRMPQDGRLRLSLAQQQVVDFRVSSLPTAFGEKIVLRILDRKAASLGIELLGLEHDQQELLLAAVKRPYGMLLVTGPTGSGKTVTLYSCLNLLNEASRNISTAEDPIEIPLAGINQVAINEKTGLSFAVALRAFLRQDPDVIMVGEIRDSATAEMALKAAQTGHLLLSTLHTNDAPSALTRLVSMGIPSYNVGDAILAIIAQRLVRKLCVDCKRLARLSQPALLAAGLSADLVASGWQPFVAQGCRTCHQTGYSGRIGVFEVMPISSELKRLILLNANSLELASQARKEGVLSLRQSALVKVQAGLTSLAEVEAHTNG